MRVAWIIRAWGSTYVRPVERRTPARQTDTVSMSDGLEA